MINLDELKQRIEQDVNIPAALLKGETSEEVIVSAKAMLAYKREQETQRPRSTAEQFREWVNTQEGIEPQDEAGAALANIEEAIRVEGGGYPRVTDAGEITDLPDTRPAREQFTEWFGNKSAWDPFKGTDGWRSVI